MSSLQKTFMKSRLPPRCPAGKLAPVGPGRKRDYTPTQWKSYFSSCENIEVENGVFRVYYTADPDEADRPRIITLHGGGYSGLSWSLFAAEITSMVKCQVISIDLRGHGDTKAKCPDDLSSDSLTDDVASIIRKLYGTDPPPIILVGHSMGGAIAVRLARLADLENYIVGLIVIDVVEGTAMDALASMQSFLRGRPTHFKSIEHAVEWCVRSGQTRNIASAKVSMPGQIVNCESGLLATAELDNYKSSLDDALIGEPPAKRMPTTRSDVILEEESGEPTPQSEDDVFQPPAVPSSGDHKYSWRIDLSKTEKHWSGWFKGLSATFLGALAPRLLLLASIDGLDRELTVGQMQGKFQMQVLSRCGHAVHEDSPAEVAGAIAKFALRHKLTVTAEGAEYLQQLNSMPGC